MIISVKGGIRGGGGTGGRFPPPFQSGSPPPFQSGSPPFFWNFNAH